MLDRHGRRTLGLITPQNAIGAAGSIGSAAAQGGMNPLADIQAALALFGMFGSKPSNDGAFIEFSPGPFPALLSINNEAGKTPPDGNARAQVLAQLLTAAIDIAHMRGVTFSNQQFVIVIGMRDPTWIKTGANLHDGKGPTTAQVKNAGGTDDPIGGAAGAWRWLQQYASGNVSDISIEQLVSQAQAAPSQPAPAPLPVTTPAPTVSSSSSTPAPSSSTPDPAASAIDTGAQATFMSPAIMMFGMLALGAVVIMGTRADSQPR